MAGDFLFHKVNEKEKEKIREEANAILDSFSQKLSKVGKLSDEEGIDRKEMERVEDSGKCLEMDRKIMFDNAPHKEGDFIVAEAKKW